MHSCFTSCNFAARTLDFVVKFWFVFRYEAVVFRRYVLALLSAGLVQKFQAYMFYLSLIRNKNPRPFSFFQKFLHFTYMLLLFRLIIPSFPAQSFFSSVVSGLNSGSGGLGSSGLGSVVFLGKTIQYNTIQ